jgi:hypothetical protein
MSDKTSPSTAERRSFLTGAVLAGAATTVGSATAQAADALGPITSRSLHFAVKGGVQAKTVHAALDRIFVLAGCRTCGLNGILDLRINVVNPASAELTKEGILGASEGLRL